MNQITLEEINEIKKLCDTKQTLIELPYNNLNMKKLFNTINEYKKNNLLKESNEYVIKINNTFYKISKLYGPDTIYMIEKINELNISNFIEIKDILNNNVSKEVIKRKNKLEELKKIINELKELDVDLDIIENKTKKHIRELKRG